MSDAFFPLLLIAGIGAAWWLGFREGRKVEKDLFHRALQERRMCSNCWVQHDSRRRTTWLKQELERAHRQLDLLGQPRCLTSEPPWDPTQEPDYERP